MAHAWQERGFFGGHTALDFINAVDDEEKARTLNALPDWPTLIEWCLRSGVLTESEANGFSTLERRLHGDLMDLREDAYAVLSARAAGKESPAAALESLGGWMRDAIDRSTLDPTDLEWRPKDGLGPDVIRVRLGLAFHDLLSRADLTRLKECRRCTGLFLDHGRGRGRQWCRMSACGNRTKVERHRGKAG